ncbi:hypothetical protein D6C80_00652 [Aureobasidium pullulans]|nr:hypothetical protein D6C80_00652 [Aureobasidium pullulans]
MTDKMRSNESKIFDNDKDFDIIIHFGEHKFHAHRIILRVMSTFFDRALTSQFAVAQNPVLELGDDDDAEAVWAMFRHMYNIDYFYDPASTNARSLDFHVAVFTVADKYDFLFCARTWSTSLVESCTLSSRKTNSRRSSQSSPRFVVRLPRYSQIVRFADKVADVCLVHFNKLICSDVFAEALTKSSLFDDRGATKLLVYVLGTSGMNLTQGTLAGKTLTIAAAKLIPK